MNPFDLPPGAVFATEYRVVTRLRADQLGADYVVEHLSTGTERALKIVHPNLVRDPHQRDLFLQHVRTAARIPSEHVVQVLGMGVDAESGTPWLATELLEGQDLATALRSGGPMPPGHAQRMVGQLCHALEAAHRTGLVHLDLKPENIFLASARRGDAASTVKVLGFGVAAVSRESRTVLASSTWAPLFLAPEQASSGAVVGPAADIWALGLVVFCALTNRMFWWAAAASSTELDAHGLMREVLTDSIPTASERAQALGVAHLLPGGFDAWFACCVVRDAAARFASAVEANAAFAQLVAVADSFARSRASRSGEVAAKLGSGSGVVMAASGQVGQPVDAAAVAPAPPGRQSWVGAPGVVLADRYRLIRELGAGAMGAVWLAEHLALRCPVAVKLLEPSLAATQEGIDRFRREAQAAATLRSANVVHVMDWGVHEYAPFLVMELLQGETLAARLERERVLAPPKVLEIVMQVGRAVSRAHAANIIHRDLKPENIFLVTDGKEEIAKLLDFGIAKLSQEDFGGRKTRTGTTLGTPYYMSPEQAEGKKTLDHRTDLWSMAVITAECMTGSRPFEGETFGELLLNICVRSIPVPSTQGSVPPGFDDWFARGTQRDPAARFASADEMIAALRAVVEGAGMAPRAAPLGSFAQPSPSALLGSAEHPVAVDRPVVPMTRRGWLPALVVLGLLTVLAAIAFLVFQGRPGQKLADGLVGTVSVSSEAAREPDGAADLVHPASSTELVAASPSAAADLGGQSISRTRSLGPVAIPTRGGAPLASAKAAPSSTSGAGTPSAVAAAPATPPSPAATPTTTAPPALRPPAPATRQCIVNPLTGAIRPYSSADGAGARPFPCKQNPATGQFQRM
ncbi:MAG: serine/threonine protein kinase [Polyangiaceae bacterium]|nr:serine/threonine protein kinase [Polyangiaceae bacterium]